LIQLGANLLATLNVAQVCCCSVLQCVAMCCSGWLGVAVGRESVGDDERCAGVMLQFVRVSCSFLQCIAVCCSGICCCSVKQCVAVCCSVLQWNMLLQCVAVYCSVLQCVAVEYVGVDERCEAALSKCVAVRCSMLLYFAVLYEVPARKRQIGGAGP